MFRGPVKMGLSGSDGEHEVADAGIFESLPPLHCIFFIKEADIIRLLIAG